MSDTFTIKRDREWDAITSAVRIEIVLGLVSIGPCSIRELAELLERPADGLYHHLRKLEAAGLVVGVDTRVSGTRTEQVYDLAAPNVTIDTDISRKRTRERVARLFKSILQHAQRAMLAALESDRAVLEEEGRTISLKWAASWLDDERLARVREHQDAVNTILLEGLRERTGELFSVLTYLAPVVRTRGPERSSH